MFCAFALLLYCIVLPSHRLHPRLFYHSFHILATTLYSSRSNKGMQLRPEQVDGFLRTHQGVLGPGWKEVNSFDELEDEDEEYEYEETVRIASMFFGYVVQAV